MRRWLSKQGRIISIKQVRWNLFGNLISEQGYFSYPKWFSYDKKSCNDVKHTRFWLFSLEKQENIPWTIKKVTQKIWIEWNFSTENLTE